ncbi:MAG: CaiB/BaiF CoA transferase family protein [Candidatus Competibacterales bacterium]
MHHQRLLADLLVVSLEQAVAAPYLMALLADKGAEVVKVERPEGDFARGYDRAVLGESSYFVWLNRGKKSVVLDIKAPLDHRVLLNMLAAADVFVQNLSVGAAQRAGLGVEALAAHNPRLITVDISGYGEYGPMASKKGYDLLIQCEAALAAVSGAPEAPGRVGVSISDIATGLYSYAAVLEALLRRGKTGRGAHLKASLFAATAELMAVPYLQTAYGGKAPRRVGLSHPSIAPYGAYPCAGGGQVVFGIQNPREWQRLCDKILGDSALAHDPRFVDNNARVVHRLDLDAIINACFAGLTPDQVTARLEAADIPCGRVNEVANLVDHGQLRTVAATLGVDRVQLIRPPVEWQGETVTLGAVPALGAHTQAIKERFA